MKQTPGKIYLADQRGIRQTTQHSRASTFSFGAYQDEHRGPFGPLYGLNEETLAGAQRLDLPVAAASYVLLLPITGAVHVAASHVAPAAVDVGEVLVLTLPAGSTVHLNNPYPEDAISFLHLWVAAEAPAAVPPLRRFAFQEAGLGNQLSEIVAAGGTDALPFGLYLGRFDGRQETGHPVNGPRGLFFAFVVAGAFEVQGRLLHAKDGLALWETEAVELEALSNHALLLALNL